MLAVIFSDVQINSYKQFNTDNCRLRNCLKAINEVFKFAAKHKIEVILFAGDLYDTQKILGTEVVNETISLFLSWSKSNPEIKFYAISGNHDHATKNLLHKPAVTALGHLSEVADNFYLVDWVNASLTTGIKVWGIPYFERKEDFRTALTEVVGNAKESTGIKLLMMHQTPDKLGNDMIPADISVDDPLFDCFDYVYCGHIHTHALLSPKFLLVGSPLHRTLEDVGLDKGFIVQDLSKPQEGYRRFSLNAKLPEFRYIREGDEVPPEWAKDYLTSIPAPVTRASKTNIDMDQFKSDLTPSKLIHNYWKEVEGGNDKELLQVGLDLLS